MTSSITPSIVRLFNGGVFLGSVHSQCILSLTPVKAITPPKKAVMPSYILPTVWGLISSPTLTFSLIWLRSLIISSTTEREPSTLLMAFNKAVFLRPRAVNCP